MVTPVKFRQFGVLLTGLTVIPPPTSSDTSIRARFEVVLRSHDLSGRATHPQVPVFWHLLLQSAEVQPLHPVLEHMEEQKYVIGEVTLMMARRIIKVASVLLTIQFN
jgi:hypothetical protein